jgi:hypothetical protein
MLSKSARLPAIMAVNGSKACMATAASNKKTTSKSGRPNIVFVDGVRTPFVMSGTVFKNLMPHDLQKTALLGWLKCLGMLLTIV